MNPGPNEDARSYEFDGMAVLWSGRRGATACMALRDHDALDRCPFVVGIDFTYNESSMAAYHRMPAISGAKLRASRRSRVVADLDPTPSSASRFQSPLPLGVRRSPVANGASLTARHGTERCGQAKYTSDEDTVDM